MTQVAGFSSASWARAQHGRRRREPAADHDHALARVLGLPPAEHVVHPVADLLLGRDLAGRRDAAVADPGVPAVGAGAIEDDVRLLEPLGPLVVAQEQPERACAARLRIVRRVGLEKPGPADRDHERPRLDRVAELGREGQRDQVGVPVLEPGEEVVRAGELVLRVFLADQVEAERGASSSRTG